MQHQEYQYLNVLKHILENGEKSHDRTGVGTLRIAGAQMRFNLSKEFPLLTTKKVHWKSIVGELLWFLSGSTNNKELVDKYGVTIWNEWAAENGELGAVYGHHWRSFLGVYSKKDGTKVSYTRKEERPDGSVVEFPVSGVDQIAWVINEIKTNPDSRRLIVSAWNPMETADAALPACHTMFQFLVINGKLNCHLLQRSADFLLGIPFNIASYSLLTHMIAHITGLKVGEFIHSISDAHIYLNHIEQVKTQLSRDPMPLPSIHLNFLVDNIFNFTPQDIVLKDYISHPPIKAPVAV